MIKAEKLTKRFDSTTALSQVSCTIPDGSVYGMVGSNGAGKSTFLRLIAGIYKPDGGSVMIDDKSVYGNWKAIDSVVLVPDELYFLPGANIRRMGELYLNTRGSFDFERLEELAKMIGLDTKKPISQFSKGMKRQAATILALACKPKTLLFDETFDGLDPVMRSVIKRIIVDDMLERQTTVIITSHSLRELEDTCDQLALLHKGGLVLESDVASLKTSLFKVQFASHEDFTREDVERVTETELISFVKHGSVANIILRGDKTDIAQKLGELKPVIVDILPLSLEEVFVYEMEALGYEFSDITEDKGGKKNEK